MFFFDHKNPNKYGGLKRLLTPFDLTLHIDNKTVSPTFERYGVGDGSYVLAKELVDASDEVFSYGIGSDPAGVSFDEVMVDLGKTVYMFDGSISHLPKEIGERAIFKSEHLNADNFVNHLTQPGERYKILKMDIEGCEYSWLKPKNTLLISQNFSQVSIEVHGLIEESPAGWHNDPEVEKAKNDMRVKTRFFERLNEHFFLWHIHGNNHAPIHGDFPDCLELTYINAKHVGNFGERKERFPIEGLDFPNHPGRDDYVLDWWVKQ